jgi:long-chain acyl-CoA synthetase
MMRLEVAPPPRPPIDLTGVQSVADLWAIATQKFGSVVALHDPHAQPAVKITYRELHRQIQQVAAGLQALGIAAGDCIALFSDNCPRWLVVDQGMMTAGAVNAVRGAQAERGELLYILSHSDSVALVVENAALLKKLLPEVAERSLKFVVLLSDETAEHDGLKVLNFSQLLELGRDRSVQSVTSTRDTLATLMYTSGTSGMPKGVMLSQGNLLSQIEGAGTVVNLEPGQKVLSILPIWHCYERSFEYFILAHGCTQIYTNIRYVKKDLKDFQPMYMVGVPRLWESIYEGIQRQFREQPANKQRIIQFFMAQGDRFIKARRLTKGLSLDNLKPSLPLRLWSTLQMTALMPIYELGDRLVYKQIREGLGGNIVFVVSGGGSIAEHLEDFFEVVKIEILGGYGLTETSPITHVRRPRRNLRGADGQPLPNTETRIVDPETRQDLSVGKQGLVLIRGAQVMQGYYKNPEATAKAIDPQGWFDTGDLGWVTAQDDLIITGRAKDTIVLTNGENIEPQPIEDACLRSPYVDQIMLVGQDQRSLGALIVPNFEALEQWATSQAGAGGVNSTDLTNSAIQELFRQELSREVKNRPGYRADDRIGPIRLIHEPFTMENGLLTQTLKIRRAVVMDRYRGMIDEMFA